MKRPHAGAERVVSDLVRRSVRFGLSISCKACAPSGRLIDFSANNCAFDSSSVAKRRRIEIVNPTALNAPTQKLAVWGFRPDSDGIARMGKYITLSSVNARARVSAAKRIPGSGRSKSRPFVAVVEREGDNHARS